MEAMVSLKKSAVKGHHVTNTRKRLFCVVVATIALGRASAYTPLSLRPQVLRNLAHSGSVGRARCGPESSTRKSTQKLIVPTNTGSGTATSLRLSFSSDGPSAKRSLASASVLVVMDVLFRTIFQMFAISFPSSLAGCGALFGTLLVAPKGEKIYDVLSPGATLLAKWLPVFFVPSLVTLPLAAGLGSALELFKVGIVVTGGFYFTLLTTAYAVLGVRKRFSNKSSGSETNKPEKDVVLPDTINGEVPSQPKAFSDRTATLLKGSTAMSAAVALTAGNIAALTRVATPLSSLFMLSTTMNSFVLGARQPKKFTKVVHPLVICTALTWLSAALLGLGTGKSFKIVLKAYRTGTLNPATAGAGDVLLFLLGPAVVSLACQMYGRRKLMKENMAEVVSAILVSSFGGLFGTAAFVRILGVGNPVVRLSLLPRNITSPLAMAIASILGADVSLAVTIVVISGLIGANFGAAILDSFGVKDAVARGLGIGAAAHGLGTAAFANDEDAFPFAAISMALTACTCTVLVSIPAVKRAVLQLALGW